MSINKPMLAADLKGQWDKLVYPVYVTTKLDGIRCLKINGRGVVSRTFKPIANKHIRETLDSFLPVQSDGEIIAVRVVRFASDEFPSVGPGAVLEGDGPVEIPRDELDDMGVHELQLRIAGRLQEKIVRIGQGQV